MRFRAVEPRTLRWSALLLAALLTTAGARVSAGVDLRTRDAEGDLVPSRPMLAEDVFDPVFAFMLAVLDADQFGSVDAAFLDSLVQEEGGSKIPYDLIASMSRTEIGPGADARVRIDLDGRFEAPIPFSILGYNPGSMRATERMDMLHWSMGDRRFAFASDDDDGDSTIVEARNAHLFVLSDGWMEMDVDGWLDRIMGGKLDDVRLSGFFIFGDDDRRVGLGFGYNTKGDGRTGAFDFLRNESIFPASKEYLSIGRQMRGLAERRLERWRSVQGSGSGGAPAGSVPR